MNLALVRSRPIYGYGLAICAWLTAFVVRLSLADWFPPGFPYLTFFPAVVVAAYFAGLGPAVLTAVLSGLTAWWFWIGAPGFDWSTATGLALGFYVFVVAVDVFFIVGMNSATDNLRREVARNAALAESRDLLLKEVQHRVSNNIQVVSSLLRLEAGMSKDPAARRALSDASARTAMIANVQRSLLDADGSAAPFDDLARQLVLDALNAAGRTDVTVVVEEARHALTADEATPVVLILLECVNNALEHAFPDSPGRIHVRLYEQGSERRLEVRDDGAGPPPDFDPAKGRSLGLRIVLGLADQLHGRFSIVDAAPGALCVLSYPRPAAH
ncbi:MAG: histidine kinase dimerization/phosphoacceptor domain -containing protein [Brevundimonas sp.]|uniref:sensor histidine kinase n=1 Tax=Brevundimonas sp. TaxID=1871086 RepID=UPI002723F1FD|nr:histidine kinase dimerization/phosphoacceptor domain -containing protein [Brevundimonas sp.]MDO9610204.1 histidine kinase dimerization/phosphoacceptor domain -containing protein [Brevundimonas sp.]